MFTRRSYAPIPLSLIAVAVVCLISLVGVLVYYFATRVTYGEQAFSPRDAALLAMFAGVLPILIVYTILEGHPISRWLLLVEGLFVLGAVAQWLDSLLLEQAEYWAWAVLISGCAGGALYWLFFSRRIKVYYAVLTGKQSLDDSTSAVILSSKNRRLIETFHVVAPYLEIAGAVCILGSVAYALWLIN